MIVANPSTRAACCCVCFKIDVHPYAWRMQSSNNNKIDHARFVPLCARHAAERGPLPSLAHAGGGAGEGRSP
jgi:hypothetical protein